MSNANTNNDDEHNLFDFLCMKRDNAKIENTSKKHCFFFFNALRLSFCFTTHTARFCLINGVDGEGVGVFCWMIFFSREIKADDLIYKYTLMEILNCIAE